MADNDSDEECEECNLSTGVGMMLNICQRIKAGGKDIDCNIIARDFNAADITAKSAKEFVTKMKKSVRKAGDKKNLKIINEIEELMFE